jgi:hypothetical protein
MKKLFILGFVLMTFLSCSTDDVPNEEFHFEILPIESVTLPTEMHYGDVYTINYTYYKPSSCHLFNDLYYQSENNFRTIAVISTVLSNVENVVCEPLEDELIERSFTFLCDKNGGTFIFKFWQGEDENGVDTYLINEVPIVN